MISRYSRKELTEIWSEENKYKIWLDVEIAAAEAMEKYKIIPKGVASIVKKKGKIKIVVNSSASSDRRKASIDSPAIPSREDGGILCECIKPIGLMLKLVSFWS